MPPPTATIARFISSRWYALSAAAVVVLAGLAYTPALVGPQIFDDQQTIQDNLSIRSFASALSPPAASPVAGRPVVNLSLAFNYWLNDLSGVDQSPDPGGVNKTISYHVLNLAIHLLCGLLLLGIVRRTLRTGRVGERWAANGDAVALAVSAVWLLHPLQTEAVDYLTQRTELIVSLFYLATLYCAIRGRFVLGAIACAAGMASKEVMVSAPLMVVLYDRAFSTESWREMLAAPYRARRRFYGALAATWVVLAMLMADKPRGQSAGFQFGVAWYEYLHTQGWAIAHYLRLALLPTALSLDYDFHLVSAGRGVPGLLLLTVLGIATIMAWTRPNRWGWFGFLGAWFFLILAPSSSVVPILTELVAERRMYLPLAAVILMVAVAIDVLLRRVGLMARWRIAHLRVAVVAVVGVLAMATFQRSRLYQDPEAIWRDVTVKVPENPRGWNNLGVILWRQVPRRGFEADSMYRTAIGLDSGYIDALVNGAVSDLALQAYPEAELLLRRATTLRPSRLDAIKLLGGVLLDDGRARESEPYMKEVVRRLPNSAVDLALLSLAYADEGRSAEAVEAAQRAVAGANGDQRVYYFAGRAMLDDHQTELAQEYLSKAVQLDPTDENARADLARVFH